MTDKSAPKKKPTAWLVWHRIEFRESLCEKVYAVAEALAVDFEDGVRYSTAICPDIFILRRGRRRFAPLFEGQRFGAFKSLEEALWAVHRYTERLLLKEYSEEIEVRQLTNYP